MKHTAGFLLASLILSLGFVQTGLAQGRMRMSAEDRAKILRDSLSLTDNQTKQVQKIYEDSQAEMQEVFQKNMGDRDAMRKAMTALNDKNDKKIETLLNDDQKVKFEKFKKDRAQMRQGGRMQNENPPPPPKKDDQ